MMNDSIREMVCICKEPSFDWPLDPISNSFLPGKLGTPWQLAKWDLRVNKATVLLHHMVPDQTFNQRTAYPVPSPLSTYLERVRVRDREREREREREIRQDVLQGTRRREKRDVFQSP